MGLRKFISDENWFSLTLPEDWSEYDDGEEGSYAFFDTKAWTGNFRITPIRLQLASDLSEDKASNIIDDQIIGNEGAIRIKIANFDCAHYRKSCIQEADELVVFYWIAGLEKHIFICSFTIGAKLENTNQNRLELKKIEEIIKGIEIH